ncbi:choline transporter-like protein 2 isoform X2 [Watersipora subatra]|uniref:choline transporter-like protein 2 isoform X2 n=1 Tax=Watersipora subatra TaxID=2589382 RepID=UPI00355BCBB5
MCGGGEVEDSSAATKEGEETKYGNSREYDPTFNGPIKKRGCTDVICCILFVICIAGMVVVGVLAYQNGDPKLLLYPSDSNGSLCGYGDYLDRPNLFFFDLVDCAKVGPAIVTNGCPTKQICVTSCPTEYWTWYVQYGLEQIADGLGTSVATARRETGRQNMTCEKGVDPLGNPYATAAGLKQLIDDELCASYTYPQAPVLGRCLPSFLSEIVDTTQNLVGQVAGANESEIRDASNNTVTLGNLIDGSGFVTKLLEARDYGEKILGDLENSKWFILGGMILAMIVAFIWIVLMRWIAGIIVWFTIAAFFGLFGFCCYYSYDTYYSMKNLNTTGEFIFTTDLTYYLSLKETWLAFGCTSATILTILLLIILFLRKRILLAIALIKEGSRAIGMMMFTLIWPIWPFLLEISLLAYWGTTCVYLASSTKKVYQATNSSVLDSNETFHFQGTTSAPVDILAIPCDAAGVNSTLGVVCSFVENDILSYTIYLQIYMLFMFFWVMNWIIGFGQMVLAGAFASYYWAFDKKEHMPVFPILGSVGRTLLYHTGSIAFGALIIAIIQIIRVGLEYLDAKLKGAENPVAKFLLKCLKCCFWCLEKFMKMINKNAYILIAIYGKNFCTAAKDAFFLIMRNIVRVAVIDKVTDFLMFISKLVIVGTMTILSFFFFDGTFGTYFSVLQTYQPELTYHFIPTIVIGVGSYIVASVFFSVYGMAVDTLFLCFLEDLERNDGSVEKPYYMNKELKDLVGKKNAKPKEIEMDKKG